MKNDTTFVCMRSSNHLRDAKMSKKGTSLHRDPSMYAAYGPRGRYRNHAFPENWTWSSLDRSISEIARCTITCLECRKEGALSRLLVEV